MLLTVIEEVECCVCLAYSDVKDCKLSVCLTVMEGAESCVRVSYSDGRGRKLS